MSELRFLGVLLRARLVCSYGADVSSRHFTSAFLFTCCGWMNTSTVRQECATAFEVCTLRAGLQTYAAPMLLFAGCHNSTTLNSLHCSIRSKFEVNLIFADVCGFDTRRASQNCSGFVFWSTCPCFLTVLLYSDTVRCPGDNSIKLGRTDASRQNCTTTNAHRMSCRYTGVMLYQALCGFQRQL